MSCFISSIHSYPVKSLSCTILNTCTVKKNFGILNDRVFSFTRNIDYERAKLIEKYPHKRKLNLFLTLKNSPLLNKYKFIYDKNVLTLFKGKNKLISVSSKDFQNYKLICNKLIELEESLLKPIFLLRNETFPFFDTTHSKQIYNTISLINLNSIKDFENKINSNIEFERFRSNFYIDGLNSWEERSWIDKIITINNIKFKVHKHIARCSAINLKPNTDKKTINLPFELKKLYNHIDMGVYLIPLEDGKINLGDNVALND